jgi:hypothetical protein
MNRRILDILVFPPPMVIRGKAIQFIGMEAANDGIISA